MKKNLLSLLLAVVLVLGLMIVATPAMATEEETTPAEPAAHSHCICVRSEAKPADHVCDETIVWEPYEKGMTLVDGGHYYLTKNEGETRNLTSSSNKLNITICLNGFTFRAQTPFKVQNGNTLTICDCRGGGAIRSSQAKGTGYSVWAGYNKGVVNLYSGILSGQINNNGVYARPVVVDGGTFNMYGGTIKNGDSGTIATGSPNVGYGGNVLVKSYQGTDTHVGTFNLFGGTIEGGKATADGGNIYVLGGALNIYGGIIKDGSAVNGGNIAANGSYIKDDQSASRKVDLTISGGTVNAECTCNSGSVTYDVIRAEGNMSMTGGLVELNGAPKSGKGILLPKGATALDFAFEIHSELGLHAQYARINGQLKSVKTELDNGDVVMIGSNPDVTPKRDWLEAISTFKAKSHINSFLNKQRKIDFVRCEQCHPLPGDEVIGFKEPDGTITMHRRDCKAAIRLASQRGDDIVAVNFEEDKEFLYPVRVDIVAVDRYHLLVDLVDCITNRLQLSLTNIISKTDDEIVRCTLEFRVHSSVELQEVLDHISQIDGVDEVQQSIE